MVTKWNTHRNSAFNSQPSCHKSYSTHCDRTLISVVDDPGVELAWQESTDSFAPWVTKIERWTEKGGGGGGQRSIAILFVTFGASGVVRNYQRIGRTPPPPPPRRQTILRA